MEQPTGFKAIGKEDWVIKLMKSIYEMKQVSRVWNRMFDKTVKSWGFEWLAYEWYVYHRHSPMETVIFVVHVDNIISAASSPSENEWFKAQLKGKWDISDLGPTKFSLSIAITHDLTTNTISIFQTTLIDHVVEQFRQSDAHSVEVLMVPRLQLHRPDKSLPTPPDIVTWAKRTPYHSLVRSLMYIAIGTRPDIAYTIGRLASFLDCYRPEHWEAAIWVLQYLKGSCSLSLTLGGLNSVHLTGYSDSDYTNCPDTSWSISGYCFSLGSGMIS